MAKKKRSGTPATGMSPAAAGVNESDSAKENASASEQTDEIARPATGELPALTPELGALVERLRRGRCVLGAGSRLLQASSYRGVVEKLLSGLPGVDASDARRVLAQRPLAAAGFVRRRLGDRFAGELLSATASPGELPETLRLL